jgi:predicted ATPase
VTEQPSGTITLVFSDIEGSTKLLESLGTAAYREALAEHRRIVREAYARYAGYEVDYEGDAFFYTFATADDAVSAVSEAMQGLEEGPIRIRVGIHTGSPELDPPKYVGMDVHTAARIMSAGHGGQVLVSETTRALVSTQLTDLGSHRLKDLEEPLPLYQLGAGSFPPLKTISNTNLPTPASSFVGRERETEEVVSLLREGARILTLSGPGGTGKTRLAIEAAAELVTSFRNGVFWVALASLRDPALVTEQIGQVVGARNGLHAHIAGQELLLLIDNLEQVVDCASELSSLVDACPKLQLLCTSRELLRVRSEVEYQVPPLGEPEAVELFSERSQLDADDTVAELCRRLDNLPLAVELAAARARMLSPAQILERLSHRLDLLKGGRDSEARQQTLRTTIEWSYDLLTEEEQRLFRALSVFAGGFTLEAAEQVAEADLDTLQSLLDKSLVRRAERFWLLETIREFGIERLSESNEDEGARDRHMEWVLDLLRAEAPRWGDPAPQEKLDRVLAEEGNIRAALEEAIERRDANTALEVVGSIGRTWLESGRFVELGARAADALELGGGEPGLEGLALISLAVCFEPSAAIESGHQAAARFRAADMPRREAYALMLQGKWEGESGSIDRGVELLGAALGSFERLGDDYCLEVTRQNIDALEGLRWPLEPEEARHLVDRFRQGLAESRRWSDPGDEVANLDGLSHALLDAGDVDEAWSTALEAVTLVGSGAGVVHFCEVVAALARCAWLRGHPEHALLFGAALRSAMAELDRGLPPTRLAAVEAAEAASREALDEETAARAVAEGEAMTVESLLDYVVALADADRA